ncbi:MAG: transcription antitermination factor NusB [Kiritimatiellia bacterium]
MATRRDAREWALQMVFSLDLNPKAELEWTIEDYFRENPTSDEKARAFAEKLVRGVYGEQLAIDATITKYAQHWRIARMAAVDRNVLRIALYELLFCPDIPSAVVINEAIDIAKYFSNIESGRFVNGILDRARRELTVERESVSV